MRAGQHFLIKQLSRKNQQLLRKRMRNVVRGKNIVQLEAHKSKAAIAKVFGINCHTVCSTVKAYKERGTTNYAPRPGHPGCCRSLPRVWRTPSWPRSHRTRRESLSQVDLEAAEYVIFSNLIYFIPGEIKKRHRLRCINTDSRFKIVWQ